jgi:hypothetical protein
VPNLTETQWRGFPAWKISSDSLELVVCSIGGHIGCVRFPGEDLNPLWEPQWPAADPRTLDPSKDPSYGPSPAALTHATICGHNLCLDRFGAPWPGENKPLHGEAGSVVWSLLKNDAEEVVITARLPQAKLDVERRFKFDAAGCHVHTRVVDLEGRRREVEWAEHPTLGGDFLNGVEIAAGVDVAFNWPGPSPGSRFGAAAPESELSAAEVLAFPSADAPACGECVAARVTEGFFQATNARLGRRITYRWDSSVFPWLTVWTEHRSRPQAPWGGVERTRGLEFSTKPFPGERVGEGELGLYKGRPTREFIEANSTLEASFTLSWERV